MSVRFEIRGLKAFQDELRRLPDDLKGGATGIVLDAAQKAKADIVGPYPTVTGNLRRGVTVTIKNIGPHGVSAQVRSTAPHAWLYEHGRCRWGAVSTPPAPVFIPVMERTRRVMYGAIAGLMRATGLTVTED